jgi:hypothetical protein
LQEYGIDIKQIDKMLKCDRRELNELLEFLSQDRELIRKLLDKNIRVIIKKILNILGDLTNVKIYYRVKCRDKTIIVPIQDLDKKVGDRIRVHNNECIIIGIVLQEY